MAADFISGWAQSEDSLRPLAFEHAAQALMVIDPKENRFIDFNIAAARLLRYERHDLLNKSVTSLFGHFTQLPYLIAFTEETLNKGQAWNNEIYAFDRNGEKISSTRISFHCRCSYLSCLHW